MAFGLTIPVRAIGKLSIAGYVLLYAANHIILSINRLPWYVAGCIVGAVLLCDILATQKAEFTAFFIANRGLVAIAVMVASVVAGSVAVNHASGVEALGHSFVVLIQFALQGALVGVIVRMLILAVFARLLRGGAVDTHRMMLLAALTILLWLFPLGESHRVYAGFYIYGFGIGFAIHYLVRNKEHTRAQAARHGRHIVELLGSSVPLMPTEIDAVRYYATQNWRALRRLLKAHETDSTTVLAIVKASRLRIKGRYAMARATVEAELEREGYDRSLETFLHLHRALSLADLGLKHEMQQALDKAMDCRKDCLLTRVTMGLRIAEELPLESDGGASVSGDPRRQEALRYIWEALKSSDVSRPQLIASIVGSAVPVTWTFLLDAYAYVLLKAGHIRFSRALLTECIYEDPYFSSPYLHLGEWCIADILRARHQTGAGNSLQGNVQRSQQVGALCLNIAIQLEGNRESLTRRRAKLLLHAYSNVLNGTLAAQLKIDAAQSPEFVREAIEAKLAEQFHDSTGTSSVRPIYQEIIDFLASGPPTGQIIDFKISESAQERLEELLDKNREAELIPEENAELDKYLDYRHGMILLKASARRVVSARPE